MIIGSNFNYSARKYLDDRQECESFETLVKNPKGLLYPRGFEVYCTKEKQWYYNASENKDSIPIWKARESNSLIISYEDYKDIVSRILGEECIVSE